MRPVKYVPIIEIQVGERRREDYGDLEGLAQSIEKWGLLHAIVLDADNRLVAGERRLRACRDVLGWQGVSCVSMGDLTEDELRELELEENLRRKDLTDYERAKGMVRLAETAAAVLRKDSGFLPKFGKNPNGGRPKKPDSE